MGRGFFIPFGVRPLGKSLRTGAGIRPASMAAHAVGEVSQAYLIRIKPLRRHFVVGDPQHRAHVFKGKANVDKEALQRAIGHQIGSSVTDDYYISQDAHIAVAQEEFEKMANEIKCIIDAT